VVGERETPPSCISSEGGVVACRQRNTLLSRASSEGGMGGGVLTEETPPSRISSKGGVVVVCRQKEYPSISHFKRGRSGGGVSTEGTPPSRISSKGGVVVVCRQREPLHLAFQARKGWWWCVDRRNPSIGRGNFSMRNISMYYY
jgi:hypothetical protein